MQQTSTKNFGKIQGDGRKFLQRFKSYLGSKISQSLNEIHIYRLQPKSANVSFFHFHFVVVVVVVVFDCQFESAHVAL